MEVTVRITVPLADELRERFARAAESCTVHRSLHPELACWIRFEYGPA
jgi:uncharacterized OsmC-like protein